MAIIYGSDNKKPDKFGVLERLSQLNDDYHVLCNVNITLLNYVKYDGKKDLGSAQMDYVIVSKKGVIHLQVKDWSEIFENQDNDVNPHEQTDKAGRVLWMTLKAINKIEKPHVTSILISTQESIEYDPKYKFVLVEGLEKINHFIKNRREEFSERDVRRVVASIKENVG